MSLPTVILPVFVDEHDAFFTNEILYTLVRQWEHHLNGLPRSRFLVVTNRQSFASMLSERQERLEVLVLTKTVTSNAILPLGTLETIRFLSEAMIDGETPLVVCHFKNPLINNTDIKEALAIYNKMADLTVISMTKAMNHPVQMRRYASLRLLGEIYFSEQGDFSSPWPDYWESRPVHDPWMAQPGVQVQVDHFYKYSEGHMVPAERTDDTNVLYRYAESDDRVRILVHKKVLEDLGCDLSDVVGIGVADDGFSLCLVFTRNQENELSLNWIGDRIEHGDEVHLVVGRYDEKNKSSETLRTGIFPVTGTLQSHVSNVPAKANTAVYCLVRYIQRSGAYHWAEPYPPCETLWRQLPSGTMMNALTGESITGRQAFPPVYYPDKSLTITSSERVENLAQDMEKGHVGSYILPKEHSICIENSIDLIRYSVLQNTDL